MFIILCVNITTAVVNIPRLKLDQNDRGSNVIFRRLFFYPVAFVILFLPEMIHRCYGLFNSVVPKEIKIVHAFALSSHGLIDGIIYFTFNCLRRTDTEPPSSEMNKSEEWKNYKSIYHSVH
eukprot:TRINITY_DN2906_c0_g1_i1.p1 TRINITY_DN2906_c0_g1~~TRINITY_DN2906_c0_g1_i1.p1  ORF type:complete len:121 (-),score=4.61 TRINITY_DN2906_c0_g1_i1:7-369(-)